MRIERFKNFITAEECAVLNQWVDRAVESKWLDTSVGLGATQYTKRATSRLYGDRFEHPPFVLELSERVRKFCGVSSYGLIEGHGRDGVVISCTFNGGNVFPHKDPVQGGFATLRCNIMTRKADAGAELFVEGRLLDIEVGELHCYLVSELEHYVTEVVGPTPRVMWMFGAAVPAEAWNNGHITPGMI